ncbi:Gpr1 family protein [Lyophyllum atratum]|nr:Gpr1 family protein [Lyophyllum atratum]
MSKQDIEKGSVEAIPPQQALGHTNAATTAAYTPRPSSIGNPGSLGLFSFASTTLILSLYNIQTRGITHPNVVVGMAIFCGGLAQLLAGMWEFPRGNMFGGTAFTSYGAFWMSYATILIPGSGIAAAYGTNKTELQSALGIYLTCWTLVTFFLFFVSLGKNIAFITLFGFLTVTFACLAAGEFNASLNASKAGGVLGVITAFVAYYIGLAELLAVESNPIVRLPLGLLHVKRD